MSMKAENTRTPRDLSDLLRRHPYLFTVLLCAILLPFGYADRANLDGGCFVYLGVVLGAVSIAAIWYYRLGKDISGCLILSACAVGVIFAVMFVLSRVQNAAIAIAVIAPLIAAAAAVFIRFSFKLDYTVIIALLILLGIAIRFVYVLYTGVGDRQHDMGYFNMTADGGHAGYIDYWYLNGLKLPDFDVTTMVQYYHPPLHHWLMAGLLSILTALGVPYQTAAGATQMLPMLDSALTMIVGYRIFRLVGLKEKPLTAIMAALCLHPTFILFGGSYNNDMLLTLMMLSSIMWGIRWYLEPKARNIVPLALCVGLGMMAKLSGWMVAPAIAFVFLVILIKNIRKPLRYIGQYALFGVISIPLGLWWQVRNLITHGVPLSYVLPLGENSGQYVGDIGIFQRLFSFGGGQLSSVYPAFDFYGSGYNEFNPTIGLFKTAMFDECGSRISDVNYPQITVTAPILFWLSVILFTAAFVCFVVMMIRRSGMISGVERAYFGLMFGVILVSYYMFCFTFPQTCTMNIRYAMPLIPLSLMGLGMFLQNTGGGKAAVWFRRVMYAVCGAFGAMSYVMFTQIA